jgi:hypothetical protein
MILVSLGYGATISTSGNDQELYSCWIHIRLGVLYDIQLQERGSRIEYGTLYPNILMSIPTLILGNRLPNPILLR